MNTPTAHTHVRRLARLANDHAGLIVVLLLGLAWSLPHAHAASAVISNGVVSLGVQDAGVLSAEGGTAMTSRNCLAALGAQPTVVSLRYLPSKDEGMDCDFEGEGWGVSYNEATYGVASSSGLTAHTAGDAAVSSFAATATTASGDTNVRQVTVSQSFRPNVRDGNVYEDVIRIKDTGASVLSHLRYRRAMHFGSAFTGSDCTFMTIRSGGPQMALNPASALRHSSTGFKMSQLNPLEPWSSSPEGPPAKEMNQAGPTDQGAIFDFDFGTIGPRYTKEFTLYYGAAGSRADAEASISQLHTEVYAIAEAALSCTTPIQPPGTAPSPLSGTPVFFMAFSNATTIPPPPPVALFRIVPSNSCQNGAISFLDAGSYSPWGQITDRNYDFGDGTSAPGPNATHTYPSNRNYSVTYTVHDNLGGTGTQTQRVPAPATDCPPTLDPIPDQSVRIQQRLTVCFHAHDPDTPTSQLSWRIGGLPRGASFDRATACMTWTPGGNQAGTYTVKVTVCDQHSCATREFHIVVRRA